MKVKRAIVQPDHRFRKNLFRDLGANVFSPSKQSESYVVHVLEEDGLLRERQLIVIVSAGSVEAQ